MSWAGGVRWGILLSGAVVSAFAVVSTKHQTRVLFTEIQRLEAALDGYEVEWGQLQLELTTLAEHNRIEQKSRQMGLMLPEKDAIVYLKP